MIFCFSGTGNSRWIAETLARDLKDKVIMINNDCERCDVSAGERILWVFPIYSWGLPSVVKTYIRNIKLNNDGTTHYMVCSCGDDIGLAHRQWRKEITRRGWEAMASYSVIMPNTYTLMKGFDVDSKELEQKKLSDAPTRIAEIASKIATSSNSDDVVRGSWAWVKTAIIYPYFKRYCMSPRPFHATDKCVGCGKCAKTCPLNNISMNDSRPQWSKNCAQCLRCYHICPHHAVAYGNATKGKGQYQELIHNA